jgi:hypothetical protein
MIARRYQQSIPLKRFGGDDNDFLNFNYGEVLPDKVVRSWKPERVAFERDNNDKFIIHSRGAKHERRSD